MLPRVIAVLAMIILLKFAVGFDAGARSVVMHTSKRCARSVASHHACSFNHPRSAAASSPILHSGEGGTAVEKVGKAQMTTILIEYEAQGKGSSGYAVINVRGEGEVEATGKLAPSIKTVPVQVIAEVSVAKPLLSVRIISHANLILLFFGSNAKGDMALDDGDFELQFGFEKPQLDETLVFTCKAGIRAEMAANTAAR
jgi:hypothetical protein